MATVLFRFTGAVISFLSSFAVALRNPYLRYELLNVLRTFSDSTLTLAATLSLLKHLVEKAGTDSKVWRLLPITQTVKTMPLNLVCYSLTTDSVPSHYSSPT